MAGGRLGELSKASVLPDVAASGAEVCGAEATAPGIAKGDVGLHPGTKAAEPMGAPSEMPPLGRLLNTDATTQGMVWGCELGGGAGDYKGTLL